MSPEAAAHIRNQIAQRLAAFEGSASVSKAHIEEADEILAMVAEVERAEAVRVAAE